MNGNARQYDKSATRKEEEAYYYSKRVREEEACHQEKNYDYADKLTDEAARLFAFSEKLRVGRKFGKKGAEKKGLDSKTKHKISYHKRRIRKQIGNMASHNQLPKNAMDLAGNKEEQNEDFDVADDVIDMGGQIATSALMKTEKATSRITEKMKSGKYAVEDQWSGNPLLDKMKTSKYATSGISPKEKMSASSNASNYYKQKLKKKIVREANQKKAAGDVVRRHAGENLYGAMSATTKMEKATLKLLKDHPLTISLGAVCFMIIMIIVCSFGACTSMFSTSNSAVLSGSYTAEDSDILAVEEMYCQMEADLQGQIDRIQTDYPGYDEYEYQLGPIGHDPYELASLLTALWEDYDVAFVEDSIWLIFNDQYHLSTTERTETRVKVETKWRKTIQYREERRVVFRVINGIPRPQVIVERVPYEVWESYEERTEYQCRILTVKLESYTINDRVAVSGISQEQMDRYALLQTTHGNKDGLFEGN